MNNNSPPTYWCIFNAGSRDQSVTKTYPLHNQHFLSVITAMYFRNKLQKVDVPWLSHFRALCILKNFGTGLCLIIINGSIEIKNFQGPGTNFELFRKNRVSVTCTNVISSLYIGQVLLKSIIV